MRDMTVQQRQNYTGAACSRCRGAGRTYLSGLRHGQLGDTLHLRSPFVSFSCYVIPLRLR